MLGVNISGLHVKYVQEYTPVRARMHKYNTLTCAQAPDQAHQTEAGRQAAQVTAGVAHDRVFYVAAPGDAGQRGRWVLWQAVTNGMWRRM